MMIETKELCKDFDGFFALDNANLSVPKGSIYGLVGPNGAGKTTIIRHVAGAMRPSKGQVFVNGQLVYENPAVKEKMVLVPDDIFFFPGANIMDMMNFYRGIYPNFSHQRFLALAAAFPLDTRRPLRRFSRGMQKQAAIWLCLACQPDVILLDEPVDGLDPVMRRTVWSLILQDVAEKGTTVLVSSHNLRELEDVCDHVGIMHKGKLVLQRNLAEMQTDIFKVQVAFANGVLPNMDGLHVLHKSQGAGRLQEYIIRGKEHDVMEKIKAMQTDFAESLPLSLEEIFIYELGGMDYAEILI